MPGGRTVQIQRAGRLGSEHRLHGFPRHGVEQTIVEHTGEVKDALQRPVQAGDAALDVRRNRDIARDDVDLELPGHVP